MSATTTDFLASHNAAGSQTSDAGGEQDHRGHAGIDIQTPIAPVQLLDDGHSLRGAQSCTAVAEQDSPAARVLTTLKMEPPQGPQSSPGQPSNAPHTGRARASDLPDGQRSSGTHIGTAVGGQAQLAPASHESSPNVRPLGLADPLLALLADSLDDLERTRIASENRLRQLTRDEEDSDGETRGLGLPLDQPEVARLAAVVEGLKELEHQAELNLKRRLRKHPLGRWVKTTVGVGEKQGARLLAAIGDPYWNSLHDRPRTVSELWAFTGYRVIELPAASQCSSDGQIRIAGGGSKPGDPGQVAGDAHSASVGVAQHRTKGQRANWSSTAKMRAFLVAESCVKQTHSPYRKVYDDGRTKYVGAVHQVECRRCGPSGKPALAGSPLSAGHQHARALRLVAKAVLKDLWLAAREIHGVTEGGAE